MFRRPFEAVGGPRDSSRHELERAERGRGGGALQFLSFFRGTNRSRELALEIRLSMSGNNFGKINARIIRNRRRRAME